MKDISLASGPLGRSVTAFPGESARGTRRGYDLDWFVVSFKSLLPTLREPQTKTYGPLAAAIGL